MFPIKAHFDIKRDYNAATGEQTNVIVENTTDRPWYDRERPELFARTLRAAKAALDPAGVLNPGVLFDPD